jgi:hypothetical protein
VQNRKTYTFRKSLVGSGRVVEIYQPDRGVTALDISNATYTRFAALANTGPVIVSIEEAGSGISWSMMRVPAREVAGQDIFDQYPISGLPTGDQR